MTNRRLKYLAHVAVSNVDKKSSEAEQPVRLCNYTDVYYNEIITPELPFMEATASGEQIRRFGLRAGDVLLTKDSETPDDIGVPAFVLTDLPGVVCGYHLALLRPEPSVDGRYLFWALKSQLARQQFSVAANGITRFGLRYDAFGEVQVPLPPLKQQRMIVSYLDRETVRIDSLIAAKQRMATLLEERDRIAFERAMKAYGFTFPSNLQPDWVQVPVPAGWRIMRLSRVLDQLTNGYVGPTRDILVDNGVPYIQSLHIKNGRIDFSRREFFVSQQWHDERPRIHLREGDVLIVQTGDIGQVAVVPKGFGEASCHALQIARVNRQVTTGQYLGAYLRSFFGYHSLLSRATGALHPHLEAGIKDIPVIVPPLKIQGRIVEEVHRANEESSRLRSILDAQTQLLRERRQALITAAVIG